MAIDIEKQKQDFINLVHSTIKREGIDDLLNWLEKSDFYTAPASTRYHGNYQGGLCEHSMDVWKYIMELKHSLLLETEISAESLAIVSLFHDLCKVNFYKQDKRNQKVDGQWVEVPYYTIEEKYPFGGHGSKSVFIAQQFIRLKADEAAAINCHMGFAAGGDAVRDASAAYERFPLAWITHVADEAATFLLDRKADV